MERSVVKDVKASLSVVWGRTWPIAAAVNRTVLSTNTTVIAANSAGWENALRWGWRLSVSQTEFILTCTHSCKLLIMYFGQMCPVQTDVQYDHSPSENWWVKCLFLQLCRVRENPLKFCPERNTSTVLPQPKRSTFARTWTVHSSPHQPLSLSQKQMPPGQCQSGQAEVKPVLFASPRVCFCWCCLNRGLLMIRADPAYWSRGCWLISSSRLFRVMELCSWPLTQRYCIICFYFVTFVVYWWILNILCV